MFRGGEETRSGEFYKNYRRSTRVWKTSTIWNLLEKPCYYQLYNLHEKKS